jgi:hypothetical protein
LQRNPANLSGFSHGAGGILASVKGLGWVFSGGFMHSDFGEEKGEIPARVLAVLLQQARVTEDWKFFAQNCGISKQEA